ncbi:MAG: hypothetical protein HC904_00570 [Blastochloris sp.]|nr:hypothetical protein [Blastochloris sp.]
MARPAKIAGLVSIFGFSLVLSLGGQDSPKRSLQVGQKESNREQPGSQESRSNEERLQELEESLALARTESEYFHEKWVALKLEHEALGLEALTANERAMQEKLVRLVGEVYRSEKSRLKLQAATEKLIEAGQSLQQAGPLDRAQRRAEYEVALRDVRQAMRGETKVAIANDLQSGIIRSVDESGLAIVNFGRAQKARIGMPFRILRDSKVVGRGKLVEIREYASALLIEDVIEKEQVKVGDRLLLETVK